MTRGFEASNPNICLLPVMFSCFWRVSPFRQAVAPSTAAAPAVSATDPFTPAWFHERDPVESPLRERLSPSEAESIEGVAVGEILETGPRIPIYGKDMVGIGTALHAVIAAELVNPNRDDAVEGAANLVAAFAHEGAVTPADAVGCARRLRGNS